MHNEGYFEDPRQHKQAIEIAAGYSVSTCFVNTCTMPVFIKDRSGIITEIEPCKHVLRNSLYLDSTSLYIFQLHRGLTTSIHTWRDQYHECEPDFQTPALYARAAMPVNSGFDGTFDMSSGKIGYKVSLAGSAINKKIIYNEDFDVVIIAGCSISDAVKVQHPYSKVGRLENNVSPIQLDVDSKNFRNNSNGLFFQCRYVVNNPRDTERKRIYGVIGDSVFPIDSQENWEYGNGELYVMYRGRSGELLTTSFNSIEDANKANLMVKFYHTQEAAQTAVHESPDYVYALRMSESQAKLQAAEVALRKVEAERDNIARKSAEDQRRHEATMAELTLEKESMHLENQYKNIETGRKITHDIIKYVPVLLTAILSIISLFAKKK